MRVSYAQNFEDLMLMRAFRDVRHGVYIDVGAHQPDRASVSLAFYEKGWRGMHVEPFPQFAEMLEAARPDERVVRAMVRDSRGPLMFHTVADMDLSTVDAAIAAEHRRAGYEVTSVPIDSMPLSDVFDLVDAEVIHWLKIDVEGMEDGVLQSWGSSPMRPLIVLVETVSSPMSETSHRAWESRLLERGYDFTYSDGLNRFYVRSDRPDLKAAFEVPPNFFDNVSITEHSNFAAALVARQRQTDAELKHTLSVLEHYQRHTHRLEHELQALNDTLSSERDVVSASRDAVSDELKHALSVLEHFQRHAHRLEHELEALSGERDALIDRHKHDAGQAASSLEAVRTLLQAQTDRNQRLELSLVEIRTSHSWRLSAPLRWAGRFVRGIRRSARGLPLRTLGTRS
jgi:FkbM family methyltransferase